MSTDWLDDVLQFEEQAYQHGMSEGRQAALRKEREEAIQMARDDAASLGTEFGTMSGVVAVYSTLAEKHPDVLSARVKSVLAALRSMMVAQQHAEPSPPLDSAQMTKLRSKFKQLCSLLGLHITDPAHAVKNGLHITCEPRKSAPLSP